MKHPDHVNLLKPANLPLGGIWADLGAGSGAFTLALRELVGPEAVIYAVDKDRTALGVLEQAYRERFGQADHLHVLATDFARPLELPPLDGVVMANSLHFIKDADERGGTRTAKAFIPRSSAPPARDKLSLIHQLRTLLKPNGVLLLVEYNVDRGNPWVPYPLSFETYRTLAPRAGFSEPRLVAKYPSSFLREFYSAIAYKQMI